MVKSYRRRTKKHNNRMRRRNSRRFKGGCGSNMSMKGGSGGATGYMQSIVGDMNSQFSRTMNSTIGNPAFSNGNVLGTIQNPNIGYPTISKQIANIQGGSSRRRKRSFCKKCKNFHKKGHKCRYCGGMGILAQSVVPIVLGSTYLWAKKRHTKRRK